MSVDAASKESMKAIDRPLFGDFWERFLVGTLYLANQAKPRTVMLGLLLLSSRVFFSPQILERFMSETCKIGASCLLCLFI